MLFCLSVVKRKFFVFGLRFLECDVSEIEIFRSRFAGSFFDASFNRDAYARFSPFTSNCCSTPKQSQSINMMDIFHHSELYSLINHKCTLMGFGRSPTCVLDGFFEAPQIHGLKSLCWPPRNFLILTGKIHLD